MGRLEELLQSLKDKEIKSVVDSDSPIPPGLKEWLEQKIMYGHYPLLTPPKSLILYNVKGRDKHSENEVKLLQEYCEGVLGSAQVVKNFTWIDMEQKIKEAQRGTLSCLFVAVMAHGGRGRLADKNGDPININDITKLMCASNVRGVPKVLLIQACQTDPLTSTTTEMERLEDIRLCYEDLSIIVSTLSGKKSKRNSFIPLLSKELSEAPIDDDINRVFTRANDRLEHDHGYRAMHLHSFKKLLHFAGYYRP